VIKLCQWDITGSCNLNCTYCREKATSSLPHLPLEGIKRIIDQFAAMQVKMVSVSGGEPLTLKFLPEVLAYLRDKVETIGLTTNATLISQANVGLIKEFCNGVQVSLDGSCAEIHDHFRGSGTFERTISSIRLMVERGINVMTRLTICRENIHDIQAYVRLAHSLGLKSAYLRRAIPTGNFKGQGTLSAQKLYSAFKIAFDTGHELGMHIGSADYFSQLEFDKKERAKAEKNLIEKPGQLLSGCSIGIEAFYLAQDGRVLFCPYLPVYCGDMTKELLSKIWEDSQMFKINRNLRWNTVGKCAKCRFKMTCGGCPAYIFLTTGKLTESDNGCWINDPVD